MAMTETKSDGSDTSSRPKYRITPRYGVWTEGNKILVQVALPGVHKDKISMKALKDYFTLTAPREDVLYRLDLDFGVDIEPEKTTSKYEDGLLRLEFTRYNPIEHAFTVPIA